MRKERTKIKYFLFQKIVSQDMSESGYEALCIIYLTSTWKLSEYIHASAALP
jgi:hypothetical protein